MKEAEIAHQLAEEAKKKYKLLEYENEYKIALISLLIDMKWETRHLYENYLKKLNND